MTDKLKVITILGTRPEIIRLSRVMSMLDEYTDHLIVHTGQNYDYELNEVFFQDLGIRKPDYFLGVETSSLGSVLGNILIEIEKVLIKEAPEAVLILGDTNSSIAGLMAKRLKIPLYHMEAGNRCFDANVPEEINRRLVDSISDFNLVYTEHARRHLLSEGFPHRRIYLTGSPMLEVLNHYAKQIDESDILASLDLEAGRYFLVSVHREENVDSKANLGTIIKTLNELAESYQFPVIVSTHPRTRDRLAASDAEDPVDSIVFAKPFGFFDYNKLQQCAFCAISDSGTISEEAAIQSFPAVTLRNAMERPEALDTGSIVITGLDRRTILNAVAAVTQQRSSGLEAPIPVDYQHPNTAQRVVNLILGTARLSNLWQNLNRHDYDLGA